MKCGSSDCGFGIADLGLRIVDLWNPVDFKKSKSRNAYPDPRNPQLATRNP